MTPPSPPLSPSSSPSSRPSSSTSNPAFHDNTPRSAIHSGLSPFRFSTPPAAHASVGAAARIPEAASASSPEQLRHRRQKSDESIHPRSSSSSPQALEEAVISADPDAGASGSPSGEPATARLKKKRTRTLTTPHQSAVLHALLAQSRFPTTAMREEVGRSIGLSARKVQVWFQNQRQKARKPRNQSTVPLSRPPQFGAFSSDSQSESVPLAGPSGSSTHFQDPDPLSRAQTYSSEHLHPSGLPAPYPDPQQYPSSDVLGHSGSSNPSLPYRYPNIAQNLDPGATSTARRFSPPFSLGHPLSQSSHFTPQAPFLPDPYDRRHSVPRAAVRRGNEPPIMLPPLRFDRPHGGQTLPPPFQLNEPHGGPDTASQSTPLSAHSRSTSSISPSSTPHFPPSFTLPPPPSRHPEGIPPPFTLQPQPQWEPSAPQIPGPALASAMSAQTGLSHSSRSSPTIRPRRQRTNSDPARRLPPLSMILQQESPQDQPLLTRPWPQQNPPLNVGSGGRRFDPVHSVLREDEGSGGHSTQGDGGRRNRHTYDFTRPSSGVTTPSPPNPSDSRGD